MLINDDRVIASRVEAISLGLEAIATWVEAIAIGVGGHLLFVSF